MLDQLFNQGHIWQRHRHHHPPALDSGFAELNQYLPGGGWPADGVIEILYSQPGIGELSLVLPCLNQLSEQARWIIWVAPPWQPNAAALAAQGMDISKLLIVNPTKIVTPTRGPTTHRKKSLGKHLDNPQNALNREILWSLEEALKSDAASAVIGWPTYTNAAQIRRLQICADQHQVPCFLFRQIPERQFFANPMQANPCALRIAIAPAQHQSIAINILKQRQGWPPPPFILSLKRHSNYRYLQHSAVNDEHRT